MVRRWLSQRGGEYDDRQRRRNRAAERTRCSPVSTRDALPLDCGDARPQRRIRCELRQLAQIESEYAQIGLKLVVASDTSEFTLLH
jgi:hypothetical protein